MYYMDITGEKAAALSGLAVLGCSPSHLVSELLNCNELTHLTEATSKFQWWIQRGLGV